jgi:uncharacterized protein YprB with RNaseH-like and TPR domain
MHKAGGYGVITEADGKLIEHDTFTCAHCQRVTIVPAKAKPDDFGDFCRNCMRMICVRCAGKECYPFKKKLEEALERSMALMSYKV